MGYSNRIMELFETGIIPERIRIGEYDADDYSCANFLNSTPPKTNYLVADYIPLGIAGTLYSRGGVGKSVISMDLAVRVALANKYNLNWLCKFKVEHGGLVWYISAEEPNWVLHQRIYYLASGIAKSLSLELKDVKDELAKNLKIMNVWGRVKTLFQKTDNGVEPSEEYKRLLYTFEKYRPALIVLDTRGRLSGIDENDNASVGREVSYYEGIAEQIGSTVLVLHHTNKGSYSNAVSANAAVRGASAFLDSLRFGIFLQSAETDSGQRYLRVVNSKQNYAKEQGNICLERDDGYLFKIIEDPDKKDKQIKRDNKLINDAQTLVNYVFKNPGITKTELVKAMQGTKDKPGLISQHGARKAFEHAEFMELLEFETVDGKQIVKLGKNVSPIEEKDKNPTSDPFGELEDGATSEKTTPTEEIDEHFLYEKHPDPPPNAKQVDSDPETELNL